MIAFIRIDTSSPGTSAPSFAAYRVGGFVGTISRIPRSCREIARIGHKIPTSRDVIKTRATRFGDGPAIGERLTRLGLNGASRQLAGAGSTTVVLDAKIWGPTFTFPTCPMPEIARLGRTPEHEKVAFLAYFGMGRAQPT